MVGERVTLKCLTCGLVFERLKSQINGKRAYCSKDCFDKGRSTVVTCSVCGKQYAIPSSLSAKKRKGIKNNYCSTECYDTARVKPDIHKSCAVCGKKFSVKPYRADKIVTCSKECSVIYRKTVIAEKQTIPTEYKTCEVCNKQFVSVKRHKNQRFCSSECYGVWRTLSGIAAGENSHLYRSGTTPSVSARVRSKQWKKVADSVRDARGNACEVCGAQGGRKMLPVHHKVPYVISKDDTEGNLMVVCQSCHAKLDNAYYSTGVVPY